MATVVLKDNYGDDLRWYFLGRAAEGMALCDAAEICYRVSRERSENPWTRCWSFACTGFNVKAPLDERSAAIAAIRAEGKCRVAPPWRVYGGHRCEQFASARRPFTRLWLGSRIRGKRERR